MNISANISNLVKLGLLICLFAGVSSSAEAVQDEEDAGVKNFVLRQERYASGSISVLRPLPIDEMIRDFLIAHDISTLGAYARWLDTNIAYQKDSKGDDDWSGPEETIQAGYGDCEDYAFLNEAVLRVMGFDPRVLAMGGLGGHHAICIFESSGLYFWFDNARLHKTTARTLEEFARHIFSEYGSSYLLDIDPKTKKQDILFKKSVLLGR